MILFLLGLVLGLLLAGTAGFALATQHHAHLRRDRALLRGRLRSVLCLVEIGALTPENNDAISLLSETKAMVTDQDTPPLQKRRRTKSNKQEGVFQQEQTITEEKPPRR